LDGRFKDRQLSVSATTRRLTVRFKLQRSNDPKQPYYFEIQAAGNYETLATSETYVSRLTRNTPLT
jgi:hypothetical protein